MSKAETNLKIEIQTNNLKRKLSDVERRLTSINLLNYKNNYQEIEREIKRKKIVLELRDIMKQINKIYIDYLQTNIDEQNRNCKIKITSLEEFKIKFYKPEMEIKVT